MSLVGFWALRKAVTKGVAGRVARSAKEPRCTMRPSVMSVIVCPKSFRSQKQSPHEFDDPGVVHCSAAARRAILSRDAVQLYSLPLQRVAIPVGLSRAALYRRLDKYGIEP